MKQTFSFSQRDVTSDPRGALGPEARKIAAMGSDEFVDYVLEKAEKRLKEKKRLKVKKNRAA